MNDLKNQLAVTPSILPGTEPAVDGTSNGEWVDADLLDGRQLYADCSVGTAVNCTSFAIAWKLQEADDSGGTGVQDIAGATADHVEAVVATNNKTSRMIRSAGQRTKRWVRVVAVVDVTVDSGTMALPIAANIIGVLRDTA